MALTVDFEFDPDCRSLYSKYVRDTPLSDVKIVVSVLMY